MSGSGGADGRGAEVEVEDPPASMTGSYCEISSGGGSIARAGVVGDNCGEVSSGSGSGAERPTDLDLSGGGHFLTKLEGTVRSEGGGLISFVADDLEAKIKLSSPSSTRFDGDDDDGKAPSAVAAPTVTLLSEIEVEAMKIAASVDSLTENLSEILHGISALTVDCLEAYRDVVVKACDSCDLNIKSMYQLMAKTEELSVAMRPVVRLEERIKRIKNLLDLVEAA